MPSIRLSRLRFDSPPFRKLGNLQIDLAKRVTLIAGHNGIGKSTILGLCAHGSGLRDAAFQSYQHKAFLANLNEIVHLDYVKEFEEPVAAGLDLPKPTLEYDIDGGPLNKRCALTHRGARREVRIVPRNDPLAAWTSPTGVEVGRDAKVPLPTIYLGMTRMLPIGEANPNWVRSNPDATIDTTDAEFIQSFINDVIGTGAPAGANDIISQSIRGTSKIAKHPLYAYSPKCISLGQDSLSAIATALASFKKLKREWHEYPGGFLVIDEIDAGFHPHAQERLARALRNAARRLDLQVLATTHSLCMIEALHPEANPVGPGGQRIDSVIYITDTRNPRVADDYSLEDIRRDMKLAPPPVAARVAPKQLKVYLEDAEAATFLERLMNSQRKRRVNRAVGATLKLMPMSIGCGNLTGLMRHDPYFNQVLIAIDADGKIPRGATNVVKLPGALDGRNRGRSPEWTLYQFISDLVANPTAHPEAWLALNAAHLTTDYLFDTFLRSPVNIEQRESSKAWMKSTQARMEEWGIIELWLSENADKVDAFETELVEAATATARLL